MATWSAAANRKMAEIQQDTGANAGQMTALRAQMSAQADARRNGNYRIAFGPQRVGYVSFSVENNEIMGVEYGDRP
jgi:hypothetical protein